MKNIEFISAAFGIALVSLVFYAVYIYRERQKLQTYLKEVKR